MKIVQPPAGPIELTNYDPDKETLFVGLSVEPHVYYKETPAGPNAGKFLQPPTPLPKVPTQLQNKKVEQKGTEKTEK